MAAHCALPAALVVVIVVIVSAQPTSLGIDRELICLSVSISDHKEIFSVLDNLDVRPTFCLQFFAHLGFRDRAVTCNQHRGLLTSCDHQTGRSCERRDADNRPKQFLVESYLHGYLLTVAPLRTVKH